MLVALNKVRKVVAGYRLSSSLRIVLLILTAFWISTNSFGQDISMFTQKISNGFLFNPSAAGVGPAQVLLSYRNNYSGANGAPNNNYLSLSSPFYKGRFGVGLNLMQDKSSLLNATYLSTAFAYHLKIDNETTISMGIAGDLSVLRLSDDLFNQNNGSDLILNQYIGGLITPDFSAGATLKTKFFKLSAAMNHLSTSWNETGAVNQFTRYLTTSLVGFLPLKDGRSRLEPYLNYRKFFNVDQILDVGLYYNFHSKVTVGLGARNFKVASASVGATPLPGIFIGYSREQIFGPIGRYLGSTNEVIFRASLPEKDGSNKTKMEDVNSNKLMYKLRKKNSRYRKRP